MHTTSKPSATTKKQIDVLRRKALSYPETHEDFPWGHSAFKVKGKAFVFLHADADGFSLSVKLPDSGTLALHLPFAEPTGYGLGKSGWVSARFGSKETAPLPVLGAWIEESYTAVAPKRLVKELLTGVPATAPAPKPGPKAAKLAPKREAKPRSEAKPKPRPVAKKKTKPSPGRKATPKKRS